jgi:hypothetical protein
MCLLIEIELDQARFAVLRLIQGEGFLWVSFDISELIVVVDARYIKGSSAASGENL